MLTGTRWRVLMTGGEALTGAQCRVLMTGGEALTGAQCRVLIQGAGCRQKVLDRTMRLVKDFDYLCSPSSEGVSAP